MGRVGLGAGPNRKTGKGWLSRGEGGNHTAP